VRVIAGAGERGPIVSSTIVVGALGLLGWAVLEGKAIVPAAGVCAVLVTLIAAHRTLLSWRNLIVALLLVILFIPIRRYKLPAGLPFDMEAYRVMVMVLVAGWFASLLVDPRVRLRRSAYDAPIGLIVAAVLASEIANPTRVTEVGSFVIKSLTFFFSFLLVFYVIVSLVRSERDVDLVVKVLVGGGAIIGFFALIERRTGFNVFNYLGKLMPLLKYQGGWDGTGVERGGRLRVYGPAEHPIALGAAFVLLLPLAVYLIKKTGRRRWWVAVGLIGLAMMATSSRTGIVMLIAVLVVFLRLRPRETRRLWPMVFPMLIAVHIAVPGAIGTLKASFFPAGGLVKDQSTVVRGNEMLANGRLAKIGPAIAEWEQKPVVGIGQGTRIVGFMVKNRNAYILDNQWLGTLLDVGFVGICGYVWLFVRAVRRCGRAAKADDTPRGWLLTGLAASLAAFPVGMLTFDAFSFIQVTFIFFILLSLSAVLLRVPAAAGGARAAAGAAAA
jgi:hypothetical protein